MWDDEDLFDRDLIYGDWPRKEWTEVFLIESEAWKAALEYESLGLELESGGPIEESGLDSEGRETIIWTLKVIEKTRFDL